MHAVAAYPYRPSLYAVALFLSFFMLSILNRALYGALADQICAIGKRCGVQTPRINEDWRLPDSNENVVEVVIGGGRQGG